MEDKERFYEQLAATLDQVARRNIVIRFGDMNAEAGNNSHRWETSGAMVLVRGRGLMSCDVSLWSCVFFQYMKSISSHEKTPKAF